jgi:hypothetical protein
MVFTIVPRRLLGRVTTIIKGFDPGAFYSVDALQTAQAGVAPAPRRLGAQWPQALSPVLRLLPPLLVTGLRGR